MKYANRYLKNKSLLSDKEQIMLKEKTIVIIGGGGLGGHIAEQLARLGIGKLILIDYDVFEESNLNRQLFSTEKRLGSSKVDCIKEDLSEINSEVSVTVHNLYIDSSNGLQLLKDADIVMDGTDNIKTRLLLQRLCEELEIPLVHGAIGGWYGQVCVVMPGDRTLTKLYPKDDVEGIERRLGNPSFIPALVASYQVAEALKILTDKGELLRNTLLYIDTLNNQTTTIQL
ncbi:MAG: HesA/MoeB/ThiF family protein [Gudongella sp.]|jgi:molybdopterin/thiamine biosynthesis adenylyltransferase|nr:HesA/MoeB/ThiF family protein [Gudongella sp.]